MVKNTAIEWCDHTFNPWVGCTKISPGCDHCYAEGWSKRSGLVTWGRDRRRTSAPYWTEPHRWTASFVLVPNVSDSWPLEPSPVLATKKPALLRSF